jgi:hypothetical protein
MSPTSLSRIPMARGETQNVLAISLAIASVGSARRRRRFTTDTGSSLSFAKCGLGCPRISSQVRAIMPLGISSRAAKASACHSTGSFLGPLRQITDGPATHRRAWAGLHPRGIDGDAAANGRSRGRQ